MPVDVDEAEIQGVYLAQGVKAFTASGPGQLSLKIGDLVQVQTGDTAWSLASLFVFTPFSI